MCHLRYWTQLGLNRLMRRWAAGGMFGKTGIWGCHNRHSIRLLELAHNSVLPPGDHFPVEGCNHWCAVRG